MLYISYDDVRTLDARARLGVYDFVLEQVKKGDFNVFMLDLNEEQRKELREIDKFAIFAHDIPVQWLEALHLYDKLSLKVIKFRLTYASNIVQLCNARQPHNFITPIIQLNIDAALRGSKVIEQNHEGE